MRTKIIITFICSIIIFSLFGCMQKYSIVKEQNSIPQLSKYNNIYVGWLDLEESRWEIYRYESIEKWKEVIYEMNVLGLQKHLKSMLRKKTITGDATNSKIFPSSGELFIKCNFEEIGPSATYLLVNLQFYEIPGKNEIYNVTVKTTSKGAFWANLESMLDATIYNLADYITQNIK
ncbi:MAG: hypothetical protein V1874_14325 [Spirochaetota bacterium]